MSERKLLAWHFVGDKLRDGRPVPADGEWLEHTGNLVMCKSGLHFSLEPFDALQYAPGNTLCLVEIGGTIVHGTGDHKGKGICSRRKIVARMDATEMLRYFARMRALSVVHLWDAPDVVLDYLITGDESIRTAAREAAWEAAGAAREAAREAAWEAAWDAAWAAGAAAWAAGAAGAAARDAARAAARDAARKDFNELVYECFEGAL